MEITRDQLRKWGACEKGYEWFCRQELTDHEAICKKLCENGNYKWAYWGITEILKDDKISLIKFGIYAAEQVLPIFEEAFPDDDRPKEVIEAIKEYINNPNTAKAAAKAAKAAKASKAAKAAKAANTANVVNAAYAAVYYAAVYYADVAYAVYYAADTAYYAYAAAYYAYAAATENNKIKTQIAEYGLSLIKE